MSLEDNTIEKRDDFASPSLTNISNEKKPWLFSRAVSSVANFKPFSSIQDWSFLNLIDNSERASGWFFTGLFKASQDKSKITTTINEREDNIIKDIKDIQDTKSSNPFKFLWDVVEMLPFGLNRLNFRWDARRQEKEIEKQLASLNIEYSEDVRQWLTEYQNELNTLVETKVYNQLRKEIESNLLPSTNQSILEKRLEQLYQEFEIEAIEELQPRYNQVLETAVRQQAEQEDYIYSLYVEPIEWKTARETFLDSKMTSAITSTSDYIRTNIVSEKMEELFPKDYWNVQTARDSVLDNLLKITEEKLIRDQTYYYETLANVSDPEARAKLKEMMLPQIEAREKYFSNIINNYHKKISESELSDSVLNKSKLLFDDEKDKILKQAYAEEWDILDETDKKALLFRDWIDSAVDLYVNNRQTREAFQRFNEDYNIKDLWFGLWNVAEQAMSLILWAAWAVTSSVASNILFSPKRDEQKRVFYDEYDLSVANDNLIRKVIKHIIYNPDDIIETIATIAVWNKALQINKINKAVDNFGKFTKIAQKSLKLDQNTKLWTGLYYTTKWLTYWVTASTYWFRGITTWVIADQSINKQLREAETEAKVMLDMTANILLEPLTAAIPWIGWAFDTKQWFKANRLNQTILSYVLWEWNINRDARALLPELNATLKEWQAPKTINDAINIIRQWRDFITWLKNRNVEKIFMEEDMNLFYKTVSDSLTKLEQATWVWANRIYTESGWILKMENLTSFKSDKTNEVNQVFDYISSENKMDQLLWKTQLDWMLNTIPDIIKGKVQFENANLEIPTNLQDTYLNRFETLIWEIKGTKLSLEEKKFNTIKMYNDLLDLRNTFVPENMKIQDMISLYSPMLDKQIKIRLNDLDLTRSWITLEQLVKDKTISITDNYAKELWFKKGWDFRVVSWEVKDILFKKAKDTWLIETLKWLLTTSPEKIWYISKFKLEDKDKIINWIQTLFWKDNIKYIEWEQWKRKSRDTIAQELSKSDSNISIYTWTNDWKEFFLYLWLWDKLIKDFEITFDKNNFLKDYHTKSAEVISDILMRNSYKEWIKFAKPINNIWLYKELNNTSKKQIVLKALKEEWLITITDKQLKFTGEWKKIHDFILESFKDNELTNNTLSYYIFETYTNRIISNSKTLLPLLNEIKVIKNNFSQWKEYTPKLVTTLEKINKLIDWLSWDVTVSRAADKHIDQFNMSGIKKEAEAKYDTILKEKDVRLNNLNKTKELLESRLVVWHSRILVEEQLKLINKNIESINNMFIKPKQDYINDFIDDIYKWSDWLFKTLYRRQLESLLDILGWLSPVKLLDSPQAKKVVSEIKETDKSISNIRKELTEAKSEWKVYVDKSLENKLNKLKQKRKELEKQLIETKSNIQTNINLLDRYSNKPEYLELLQEIDNLKDISTPTYIFSFIENNKELLSTDEDLVNYLVNKLYNPDKPILNKQWIDIVRKSELLKSVNWILNWVIDADLDLKESSLLKMFGTALTWATNDQAHRWDIINQNIIDEFIVWFKKKKNIFTAEPEDKLKKLLEDSKQFKLNEDRTRWIDAEWNEYRRVTDFIWNILDERTINPLFRSWLDIWNKTDQVVRDFFNWTLKDNSHYKLSADDETFNLFVEQLKRLKNDFDSRWEQVYANNIVIHNKEMKVAWELDILTLDKDWVFRLYDITTKRAADDTIYNSVILWVEEWFDRQLNMYRILLNNTYWINVDELWIIPTRVFYEQWDEVTSILEIKDNINIRTAEWVYEPDWISLWEMKSEFEINEWLPEWAKEITNLSELYFSPVKNEEWLTFKDIVDWFRTSLKWDKTIKKDLFSAKNDSIIKFNNFKKYIDEVLNKSLDELDLQVKVKWVTYTWENALKQLKQSPNFYSTLFKRFKSLSNKTNDWTILVATDDWLKIKQKQIVDKVLLTEEIKKAFNKKWLWFRTINVSQLTDLNKLANWEVWAKLKSRVASNLSKDIFDYNTWKDSLEFVTKQVNEETKLWKTIRDELWLKDNEYIVWTYWNKWNTIQIFETNLKEPNAQLVEEQFLKEYIEVWWFKLNKQSLSLDKINKRETAMVSNAKEFEDVVVDTKTYVLEEIPAWYNQEVNIYNLIYERLEKSIWNDTDRLRALEDIKSIEPDFNIDLYSSYTTKELLDYIKLTYKTDLQDWTSFMSRPLAELHDFISTWTNVDPITKTIKDKAKKFHFTWLSKDWEAFLSKTLFNRADIQIEKSNRTFEAADNIVLIWDSSKKLEWWYKAFEDWKTIRVRVNWKEYKAIWEIKWTNTSHFRNAASDSFKIKDEQTLSEQLVNLMHYSNKDEYIKIVEKQIDDLFQETIWGITSNQIELSTFWDANIFMNNLAQQFNVWQMSDTILWARIKVFLDWVRKIIDWNKIQWHSHDILHSIIDLPNGTQLKRNEVIVSKNSDLYKKWIKELKEKIEELESISARTPEQESELALLKDQETNWLLVSWFRNPAPNKENLWLYRIILAEDVWFNNTNNTYVSSHDVMLHPETTYDKIQWDNDWDFFVMLPVINDTAYIVAKTSIWLKAWDNLSETLLKWWHNTVALIKQIWDDVTDTPKQKVELWLIANRYKNLEAKETVSLTSSMIRTVNILAQMMDSYRNWNSKVLKTILWDDKTLEFHLNKVIEKEKTNLSLDNIFKLDNTYWGKVWSILQLVLDFAKDTTGKPFNKQKWIKEILEAAWITNPKAQVYIYENVLSPMSMSHKKTTEQLSFTELYSFVFESWKKARQVQEDKLKTTLWARRDLIDYLYKPQASLGKINYLTTVYNINKTTEIDFYLDNILNKNRSEWLWRVLDDSEFIEFNNFIKKLNTSNWSTNNYISKDTRFKLNEFIEDANQLWKFDEFKTYQKYLELKKEAKYYNKKWKLQFYKLLKDLELFDSNWKLRINNDEKDLLALQTIADWNYSTFNLLTDAERIDVLSYSQSIRINNKDSNNFYINSLLQLNPEFRYSIILDDIASIQEPTIGKQKELIDSRLTEIQNEIKELDDTINDVSKALEEKIPEQQSELNTRISQKESELDLNETLDLIDVVDEVTPDSESLRLQQNINTNKQKRLELTELEKNFEDIKKELSTRVEEIQLANSLKEDFKITPEEQNLKLDYFNDIDITFQMWERDITDLKWNINFALDFHQIMQNGLHLTNISALDYYVEWLSANLYLAKDLYWRQGLMISETKTKLDEDLLKYMKKQWVDLKIVDNITQKINMKIKHNVEWTTYQEYKDFTFNSNQFLEEVETMLTKSETLNDMWNNQDVLNYFREYTKTYNEKIVIPSIKGLQAMNESLKEVWWYKVEYSKYSPQFIKDLIWMFNWDLTFEFRRRMYRNASWELVNVLKTEATQQKDFLDFIKQSAKDNNARYSDRRAKQLYNALFVKADSWMVKFIKELQWLHYAWSYQFASLTLGWTWHIAWMTQILGNTLELIAWARMLWGKTSDANKGLKDLWLLAEDLSLKGQWLERQQMSETISWKIQAWVSRWIISASRTAAKAIMKLLKVNDDLLAERIARVIDTWITEPLYATDLIQEIPRKQVALMLTARELWYKSVNDLVANTVSAIDKERVRTLFYRRHSELWGWVISTMPILRETAFTSYAQDATKAEKIFKSLYKYLNGWSFMKTATMAERSFGLIEAMKHIRNGKSHLAKPLIREFMDYYSALWMNIWIATWIAVKFSKYNDTEDLESVDPREFVMEATNVFIALQILFERERNNIINWVEWDTMQSRMALTTIDFLEYITRIFKANPIKIWVTTKERMEVMDEWFMTAFYKSLQSSFSSYNRWAFWTSIQSMYADQEAWWMTDSLWLFYWSQTKFEQLKWDAFKSKKAARIDSVWLVWSVIDTLMNYVKPNYFASEAMQKVFSDIMEDEEIKKLYNIWLSSEWYDLDNLMMRGWRLDMDLTQELYKQLITYQNVWQYLDETWNKKLSWTSQLYNEKYNKMITNLLLETWVTVNDFFNHPIDRSPALQKLFYLAQEKEIPELSTKYLTSYILEQQYSEMSRAVRKNKWTWSTLTQEEDAMIKRKILQDAQNTWLLDLNLENHQKVLWLHTEYFHEESLKTIMWAKWKWMLMDYMDALMISTHNLKQWDTSAKVLTSKYARWLSWLLNFYSESSWWYVTPSATAINIQTESALNMIKVIQDSTLDNKAKIVRTAALLTWLNDASWNMLENNELFKQLTLPAQKQLISWIYKTNKDLQDYDSNSIANYQTNSTFSSSNRWKYFPNFFKKNSGSWYASWARPWFSNQFPNMPQYMQGKSVPQNFERIATWFLPKNNIQFRALEFPASRAITMYYIQQTVDNIVSQPAPNRIYTKDADIQQQRASIRTSRRKKKVPPKRKLVKAKPPVTIRRWTIESLPWAIDNI